MKGVMTFLYVILYSLKHGLHDIGTSNLNEELY